MFKLLSTLTVLLLCAQMSAQDRSKLISGPMLGYAEHRQVLVWMEVAPSVEEVAIRFWPQREKENRQTINYDGVLGQQFNPIKMEIGALEMGTVYSYEIILDDTVQSFSYPLEFSTKTLWEWRTAPPEFSFLIGSCAYINDSVYDRPGRPYGQDPGIYQSMSAQPSDFMLWLGDNLYLREADWSSVYGIQYRFHQNRKTPELQELLASRPHYAIWDDHDYGPNNSDKSYYLKETALKTFQDYWGNRTYGHDGNPGIYSQFSYSDVDFFLLDNRYYRSGELIADSLEGSWNPAKDFLGDDQMDWLKNALLHSRATFKFIACGSQMINLQSDFEAFHHYKQEWWELMSFIKEHQIQGLIFLSGDRHFTEVLTLEMDNFYPFYEITASPLSSRPFFTVAKSEEGANPQRVNGTLTGEQNFIKIAVTGGPKARMLKIQCYNIDNTLLWEKELNQDTVSIK